MDRKRLEKLKMKKYTIYFEFFGKNLKFTTQAKDEIEAKIILQNKINILKIEEQKENSIEETVKKIFEALK
jgi:hypothetical protein